MSLFQIVALIELIIYFAVLLFAVMKDKHNKTIEDYFFGGRKLSYIALSITFIASWWGAGSALSTADLAFEDGIGAFWYYGVPVLVSTFIMIIFSKKIRRVGYLTQGRMMEKRYSLKCADMLSVITIIYMVLNASSQMVGIGSFFGTYLGLDFEVAIILGTSVVLIYSWFGGFKGVVLTDIIQFILLFISAMLVFTFAWTKSGGINNIAEIAMINQKTDFFSLLEGGKKYFMYVITFGLAWTIPANVWQRISATRNDKDAFKMTTMSFVVFIPLYLTVVLTGMAGTVLYKTLPEGGIVTAIVIEQMPLVLGGIIFVGISAAIMSTMDSLINTAAMVFTMDLLKKDRDEKAKFKIARFSTLIVSFIALLIALKIRSILDICWIASDMITTGVFIPLVLGFVWRRGNAQGAFASMVFGFFYCIYNLFIRFGLSLPSFWEQQSPMQVIIGICLSAVLYFGISLLTPPDYENADDFINKAKTK